MKHLLHKVAGLGLNLWSLAAPQSAAKAAINLFATPPRPRLREKERAFLATATQLRRHIAGQDIVEYHWGDTNAPLALLSYGWGYNAGRWRHFVPDLLEAGYRVLAYDPPGHGLAPAGRLSIPLNAAIIEALVAEYGPVEAMITHSFGGSSSVYALQNLPRHLHPRRMVVMASFSYAPLVFREYRKALGMWPALYWRIVRNFEQHIGRPIDDFDFAQMAGDLSHVDGLLVHHPGDAVTPYAEALRYFDFWPGSRLFSPQEGGHHLGTPRITQSVLDFVIDGVAPEGAERQERPLHARHELARHFAGM